MHILKNTVFGDIFPRIDEILKINKSTIIFKNIWVNFILTKGEVSYFWNTVDFEAPNFWRALSIFSEYFSAINVKG